MSKKNVKIHIELLRIIAIFLVIYNHTRADGFNLYMNTDSVVTYFASLSFSVFCKVAVPVFFMISGALLVSKEESIKDLFLKRILRIVLVILIFTLLQYIRLCIANNNEFSIKTYFAICYSGNVIEPYWYLKAYLGYLLVLPFLRAIARNLDLTGYKYLLVLGACKIIIDIISIVTGYQMNVTIAICSDIMFYPLLGHMIENVYCPGFLKKNCFAIPLLIGVLTFTVVCAHVYKNITGSFNDLFLSVSVFPLAALLYIAIKNMQITGKIKTDVLKWLGGCVFGAYLIEDVVRNFITYRLHWNFSVPSAFISVILFTLVSTAISLICILPFKKIPLINKLI